jgi:hypothetical protein
MSSSILTSGGGASKIATKVASMPESLECPHRIKIESFPAKVHESEFEAGGRYSFLT